MKTEFMEACNMKILVIEDEKLLADSIKTLLEGKGFEVEVAYDGETGVEYAELGIYDLLILDVMMPKMDGYQVAREVRAKRCTTSILMLTAKSAVEDRIYGLNSGADYYLTKPFDTRELLACINALLRRQGKQVDELVFGNTSLDLDTCTLVCGGKSVRLSAREFDVMRFLLQAQDRILSKEMILARVWGYDSNAVGKPRGGLCGLLRKKLSAINSNVRIEAVRRLGVSSGGGGRMIRRLRVKFICINMAIVTVMMLAILGMLLHFTRNDLEQQSIRVMQSVMEDRAYPSRPGEFPRQAKIPYFYVSVNTMGELSASFGGYYDLTNTEAIQEIITLALNFRRSRPAS